MFTPFELMLLAEALTWRINYGAFDERDSKKKDEIVFDSPEHEKALNELADKVVSFQEADQDDADETT